MKILPFIARGTSYYLKMSVKKLVPFLVVGLMLAVVIVSMPIPEEMDRLRVGMIILLIIKMGARRLISGACILVSVLLL